MARPLGVVEALQRAANTVAAGQRRPAATVLLPGSLALQEAQGVRLHRLWNQTGTQHAQTSTMRERVSESVNSMRCNVWHCDAPLVFGRPVTWTPCSFLWGQGRVTGLDVGSAAGRRVGAAAVQAVT